MSETIGAIGAQMPGRLPNRPAPRIDTEPSRPVDSVSIGGKSDQHKEPKMLKLQMPHLVQTMGDYDSVINVPLYGLMGAAIGIGVGAVAGAGIGAAVGGPMGAVIGALSGGAVGGVVGGAIGVNKGIHS